MSKLSETYIKRENLWKLVKKYDISTYTAREASWTAFKVWQEYYSRDRRDDKTAIYEFDIMSQVEMFEHDLSKLYEES